MKLRQLQAHMKAAHIYGELSYCQRRKVGTIIVKKDRVISIGYNGTAPGEDNCCEDETGLTKADVIHAEHNAIIKLQEANEPAEDSTLFVTTMPCLPCAKMIVDYGIKAVFYDNDYSSLEGIDYLKANGVVVTQLSTNNNN